MPAAATLLAGPTALAFFSGGYDVQAQLIAVAVSFAVLGVVAATAPWPILSSPLALLAAGALVGLAVWTGLSTEWARIRDLAADETTQLTLYATAFVGGAALLRHHSIRSKAPAALLGGVLAVAAVALAGRLLPDVFPVATSLRAGSRIQEPLTYWNALGLLMAFGMLLAAAVAADARWSRRARTAACAAALPCAMVLYLTFSRGSLVALAAGFVVLILARPRWATLAAGGLVLAAATALAFLLQLFPAVLELGTSTSRQTSQGAIFLLALIAGTVALGLGFARLAVTRDLDSALPLGPRFRRGLALVTVAAVVGVGWLIATGSEKTDPLPSSKARLTELSTNRGEYWRVAVDSFAAHPLIGVGAGSFGVEWRRERSSTDFAQDAHSLYLETLAELGLVGALLLAVFLAAVIKGLLRVAGDPTDPAGGAAAACVVAFLVHAGIDWTWELPAVTLVALLLAAAAVQPASPRANAGSVT